MHVQQAYEKSYSETTLRHNSCTHARGIVVLSYFDRNMSADHMNRLPPMNPVANSFYAASEISPRLDEMQIKPQRPRESIMQKLHGKILSYASTASLLEIVGHVKPSIHSARALDMNTYKLYWPFKMQTNTLRMCRTLAS